MATWLRFTLAAVLAWPVTLLSGLILGTIVGLLPRWSIGDLLHIPTLVIAVATLVASVYALCTRSYLWLGVFALAFTTLLAHLIPFFTHAVMFINRPQMGERYRNVQFVAWLAASFYFVYSMLGLVR
jgi:hypothetical protein